MRLRAGPMFDADDAPQNSRPVKDAVRPSVEFASVRF